MNLLHNSKNIEHQVRGLIHNEEVYIWNAYDATHYAVREFLFEPDINDNEELILFLIESLDETADVDARIFIYDDKFVRRDQYDVAIISSAGFQRMTRDLKIRKWS